MWIFFTIRIDTAFRLITLENKVCQTKTAIYKQVIVEIGNEF